MVKLFVNGYFGDAINFEPFFRRL